MSYPRNAASPPPLFAGVVNATDGAPITSGVAAQYSTGAGSQGAGAGTCQHEGNGQWSYTPSQAETNVIAFGIQFYHTDAVGDGPTISVVTSADVAQTGDVYAQVGVAGAGLTALGDTRLANLDATISSRSTYAGGAVASVTGSVGSIAAGGITATSIATDAIDADALATDAVAEIADAIWDEATSGHSTAGTFGLWATGLVAAITAALTAGTSYLAAIAAAVWANATRTLTQSAASVTSAVSGSTLTVTRGDTFSATITGLGSIAGRSKLWFTVKRDPDADADTAALVFIEETAGLTVVNGATYATSTDGSITVNDEETGSITITVKPAVTDDLAQAEALYYDVQSLIGAVVTTETAGRCNVNTRQDVTRAIA